MGEKDESFLWYPTRECSATTKHGAWPIVRSDGVEVVASHLLGWKRRPYSVKSRGEPEGGTGPGSSGERVLVRRCDSDELAVGLDSCTIHGENCPGYP